MADFNHSAVDAVLPIGFSPRDLIIIGIVFLFIVLLAVFGITADAREARRIRKQWASTSENDRAQMRDDFVKKVYELSGRSSDPVRNTDLIKSANFGLQFNRLLDNLTNEGWVKSAEITAGAFQAFRSEFNKGVSKSVPGVMLSAAGLETLENLDDAQSLDLRIGRRPRTVVTTEGRVIDVTNNFYASVHDSQFNQGDAVGVQINQKDASDLVSNLRGRFGEVITTEMWDSLSRALAEDGTSALAVSKDSRTSRWLGALTEQIPATTAAIVSSTLRQLLGG